jgi:hypothetical protein
MVRLKGFVATAAVLSVMVQIAQGQQPAKLGFNADSITSEQFRSILRAMTFAPDTESGDHQALLVGHYPDSAQFGPLATILPEERSYRMSPQELMRGQVIARITNASVDSYPRLGLLPNGVTYWWVQYNERTETGRSVLIAIDADSNIVRRTNMGLDVVTYHTRFRPSQPLARFYWTEFGELLWGWCGWQCCRLRVL